MKFNFKMALFALGVLFTTSVVKAQNESTVSTTDNTLLENPQEIPAKNLNLNQQKAVLDFDFSDDFNIANTTTLNGWTEQIGDWTIDNNQLKSPGGSHEYLTVDGSEQLDGTVTVRAIYDETPMIKFAGVVSRYTSSSEKILFKIQDNTNTGHWNRVFVYAPGFFWSLTGEFGTDAIIQMQCEGETVTVRVDSDRDGLWEIEEALTVPYTTPGLWGVAGYRQVYMDDFILNTTVAEPSRVPMSNWAIAIVLLAMGVFIFIRKRAIAA